MLISAILNITDVLKNPFSRIVHCLIFDTKLYILNLYFKYSADKGTSVKSKPDGTKVPKASRKSCGKKFTNPKGNTKITTKTRFRTEADTKTGAKTKVNAKERVKAEEKEKKWDWDSQGSYPLFYFRINTCVPAINVR